MCLDVLVLMGIQVCYLEVYVWEFDEIFRRAAILCTIEGQLCTSVGEYSIAHSYFLQRARPPGPRKFKQAQEARDKVFPQEIHMLHTELAEEQQPKVRGRMPPADTLTLPANRFLRQPDTKKGKPPLRSSPWLSEHKRIKVELGFRIHEILFSCLFIHFMVWICFPEIPEWETN